MRNTCQHCGNEFSGRSDKRFCSAGCKNIFNNDKRKSTIDAVKEIDGFLHRNREILEALMKSSVKETFDRLVLERAGFRWDYFTGTHTNKEGKLYRYVYDYAWMDFTTQQVLVVRKKF